jgi:hypothetical protein
VAIDAFDPGAMLGATYRLSSGVRVRLRLAAPSDAARLRQLMEARGLDSGGLEVARLTRFDPRVRVVICAASLIDGSERLVGVGAIDLDGTDSPDLLVSDEDVAPGAGRLLAGALVGRAQVLARRRPAA